MAEKLFIKDYEAPKDRPEGSFYAKDMKYPCPNCNCHGGWYEERWDMLNRHMCRRCVGWGWLREEDARCDHKFQLTKNLGRCYNEYTCTECGQKKSVDSSD